MTRIQAMQDRVHSVTVKGVVFAEEIPDEIKAQAIAVAEKIRKDGAEHGFSKGQIKVSVASPLLLYNTVLDCTKGFCCLF